MFSQNKILFKSGKKFVCNIFYLDAHLQMVCIEIRNTVKVFKSTCFIISWYTVLVNFTMILYS